jgi:Protein of unknown function (DUF3304)
LKDQFVLASAILVAVVGCGPVGPTAPSKNSVAAQLPTLQGTPLHTGPHKTPKGMKGLGITGYNYTDSYLDTFSVNGAGGGNVYVSTLTSGGGGVTCCASIPDDMTLPITVEISWRRDGDAPYCKQTVLLDGPVATEPNYLEVHFYQDGTIQLAITDYLSPPRVKLKEFSPAFRHASGNVDNDLKYSECKRG